MTEVTDITEGIPSSEALVLDRRLSNSGPTGFGGPRVEDGVDKQVPQELRLEEFAKKS